MINENNFLNKNEIKNDPPKKDYSDEEISEKLSKGVGLDKEFALYLLKENKKHALFENLDKFKDYNEMTIELIKDGKSYFIVERLNNIPVSYTHLTLPTNREV